MKVINTDEKLIDCKKCIGVCCRYISVSIDEPEDEEDYQFIRWYLLHENISIFIDDEDDWFVEFKTKCKALNPIPEADLKFGCSIHSKRPLICREHTLDTCEMNGEGDAWKIRFETLEEFENYMKENYKKSKKIIYEKIEDEEE